MAHNIVSPVFTDTMMQHGRAVHGFLDDWLTQAPKEGEAGRSEKLVQAMRHGVLNGGKRFRPFLVMEAAKLAGGNRAQIQHSALFAAAAIEAIHCYSLVHDDLPAMDDDILRRGQPTVHVAFDEATAILAGDALLTEAFGMVCMPDNGMDAETRCKIIAVLARDAGTGGMVGGQSLDLLNEHKSVDEQTIITTQALKTGALIRASCEIGALVGKADDDMRDRLIRYGALIGLTFQIADDLLDLTADAQTMGKLTGKDAAAGKQTLLSMHGEQWAHEKLAQLVAEATGLMAPYGERGAMFCMAANFVAYRRA